MLLEIKFESLYSGMATDIAHGKWNVMFNVILRFHRRFWVNFILLLQCRLVRIILFNEHCRSNVIWLCQNIRTVLLTKCEKKLDFFKKDFALYIKRLKTHLKSTIYIKEKSWFTNKKIYCILKSVLIFLAEIFFLR